jgi:adenosylmethionine-8-amino-7-oxononanoate aminotransferase
VVTDTHIVYGWLRQFETIRPSFVRGKGIHLWDSSGQQFMDFCSGQINVNIGYSHPHVLEAMGRQLRELAYIAPMFNTDARRQLAKMLCDRLPAGLDHVFFTNSGSEAIEAAIKVARSVTGRNKIYSAWRSYHGATSSASSMSGDPRRLYVEPGPSGLRHFHAATCYHCAFGQTSHETCGLPCLESLKESILLDCPETVAAVVLEPIVGTSGLFILPAEFVSGLASFCKQHGILLIFDETMTGWGRTGAWFACQHYNVSPDILTTAKGITSGYVPLGAAVITKRLYEHFLQVPFVSGSTTEGHPLACAAGVANIEVYRTESLIERSRVNGNYLLERLTEIAANHLCIGDVRGKGLFACVELTSCARQRTPLAGYRDGRRSISADLTAKLFEAGLLVLAKWDFVFIAPPLIIEQREIDAGLSILDDALYTFDKLVQK